MSEEQQSFADSAKDAIHNAAQYVTGALFSSNADNNANENSSTTSEPAQESNLKQPWDISAPNALPGPDDGLKYGSKPASPEEGSNSSTKHALCHPDSSLKI